MTNSSGKPYQQIHLLSRAIVTVNTSLFGITTSSTYLVKAAVMHKINFLFPSDIFKGWINQHVLSDWALSIAGEMTKVRTTFYLFWGLGICHIIEDAQKYCAPCSASNKIAVASLKSSRFWNDQLVDDHVSHEGVLGLNVGAPTRAIDASVITILYHKLRWTPKLKCCVERENDAHA